MYECFSEFQLPKPQVLPSPWEMLLYELTDENCLYQKMVVCKDLVLSEGVGDRVGRKIRQ